MGARSTRSNHSSFSSAIVQQQRDGDESDVPVLERRPRLVTAAREPPASGIVPIG
jgi:hypothetical protein